MKFGSLKFKAHSLNIFKRMHVSANGCKDGEEVSTVQLYSINMSFVYFYRVFLR